MYNFGKLWKYKISLMGFVYRVLQILLALWIVLSEIINILRKLKKRILFKFCDAPPPQKKKKKNTIGVCT